MNNTLKQFFIAVIFLVNYSMGIGQNIQSTGSLQYARWYHQSAMLPDGRVMVFGGDNGRYSGQVYYASTEIYNPATRTWIGGSSMNDIRDFFASVVLNDGSVLAIGGDDGKNTLNSVERYNPVTNQWSYVSPMLVGLYEHQAVKLKDGRVLIAGGLPTNNTCQIYDPVADKWSMGATLSTSSTDGSSMVLLQDGRVLMTGGRFSERLAEIYDPEINQWTKIGDLKSMRRFHGSMLLNDGRVLIVGGTASQTTSEIFDPATNSFTLTGNLAVGKNKNCMVLLPDGKVLAYGLMDININTKIIEVYDPAAGTWSTGSYTNTGSQSFTINTLENGSFLVAGGSFTTMNGATDEAYTINMTESGDCSSIALNNTVSTAAEICYGKGASIEIAATQTGWNYQAFIAGRKVGNVVSGGGNIQINVPFEDLSLNDNLISIRVSKSGCNTRTLANKAKVKTIITNNTVPKIIKPEALTVCQGNSVLLSAENTATGYLWSNGQKTKDVNISKSDNYWFRVSDANNCLSNTSDTATVKILPPVLSSSFSFRNPTGVCKKTEPFLLDITPTDGKWSGSAIDESGLFDPSRTTAGDNEVTYNYCGEEKTYQVKVDSFNIDLQTNYFEYSMESTSRTYSIINTQPGVTYTVMVDGVEQTLNTSGTTKSFSVSKPNDFVITTEAEIGAGVCRVSKIQHNTVKIIPRPTNEGLRLLRGTLCVGDTAYIVVENSIIGVNYYVEDQTFAGYQKGRTVAGTGGTIYLPNPYTNANNTTYKRLFCYVRAASPLGGSSPSYPYTLRDPNNDDWNGYFYIYYVDRGLNFTTEPYYIQGDILNLKTSASYKSYTWTIDGNIYSAQTPYYVPENVILGTEGKKMISLKAEKYGCADSISQNIEVYAPAQNGAPYTACSLDMLAGEVRFVSNQVVNAIYFHIDKQGNRYVSALTERQPNGAAYSGGYGMSLKKYDAEGNLLWEKSHTYNNRDFCFSSVNGMDSDAEGNLYVAGNYESTAITFDDIYVPYSTYSMSIQSFILKINKEGVIQWIINSEHEQTRRTENGASDIHIDPASGHLLVSLFECRNMRFTDGSLVNFNSELVILEIDNAGKYIKNYANGYTASYNSGLICAWEPTSESQLTGRAAVVSPKFTIKDGKIVIFGNYSNQFKVGDLMLPVASTTTKFVTVLDKVNGWEKHTATMSLSGVRFNRNNALLHTDIDEEGNYYSAARNTRDTLDYRKYLVQISNGHIAKYDSEGNKMWSVITTDFSPVSIMYINEQILVSGHYNYAAGTSPRSVLGIRDAVGKTAAVKTKGAGDIALMSFDKNGNLNWIETIGGLNDDGAAYMIKGCDGAAYLLGTARKGTLDCLGKSVEIAYTNQYFVAKYAVGGDCNAECPVISPPTSISSNESELSRIKIYPNPAKNHVTIENISGTKILVKDMTGKIITEIKADNNTETIDISAYPAGVYLLNIVSKTESITRKLIKN